MTDDRNVRHVEEETAGARPIIKSAENEKDADVLGSFIN
jgi:hypothetical protein